MAPFVDFLEHLVATGATELSSAHVEVAGLEWAEFVAYASEAGIPAADDLQRAVINPTLTILQLRHPVAEFVDAVRAAESDDEIPPLPTAPAPNITFVLREPHTDLAVFHQATDELLFALKLVHDGVTVPEAAKRAALPAAQIEAFVQAASDIGLVILP